MSKTLEEIKQEAVLCHVAHATGQMTTEEFIQDTGDLYRDCDMIWADAILQRLDTSSLHGRVQEARAFIAWGNAFTQALREQHGAAVVIK